jgi:hypothetical protein
MRDCDRRRAKRGASTGCLEEAGFLILFETADNSSSQL